MEKNRRQIRFGVALAAGLAVCTGLIAASPAAGEVLLLDAAASGWPARVAPSGQKDAAPAAVPGKSGGMAVEFTCRKGESAWPGIAIRPESAVWDLSACGYVEAVVANPGAAPVKVSLRVDDKSGRITNAWNTATVRVGAMASATARVYLDFSDHGRNYRLVPSKIGQVLVFADNPDKECRLRLESLAAKGRPGDVPPEYVPRSSPQDGNLLGTMDAAAFAGRVREQGGGLAKPAAGGAVAVTVPAGAPAAPAAVFVVPPRGKWDLSAFNQVEFRLFNPGTAPVQVSCLVANAVSADLGNGAAAAATLAPGARQTVVVSFISDKVWDGSAKSDQQTRITDAASEKVLDRAARDGQLLFSDEVAAVAVAVVPASAEQSVVLEGVKASVAPPAVLPDWLGKRPPAPGNWRLTLNENFDGTALDERLWTPRMPYTALLANELQRYSRDNVTVAGGFLKIQSEKRTGYLNDDPKSPLPTRDYSSGALTTYGKWTQTYGYFESRMKLPRAPVLWPAFWMMPDRGAEYQGKKLSTFRERYSTDVDGMEFDILENLSRFGPYRFNLACHWDGYAKDHKKVGTGRIYFSPDAEGFVTLGLLWEPGRLTWYCNGRAVGVWSSPRIGSVPMHLIFCTQMGGWAGFDVNDSRLPDDFVVDYVRAWQKTDGAVGSAASAAPLSPAHSEPK